LRTKDGPTAAAADERRGRVGVIRDNRERRSRLSGRTLGLGITDKLDVKNTTWDSDFVTHATQKLLDEFEALPDRDRSELVAELARRVALAAHDLPQDEDLVAAADRLFTELDGREQPE
jgi:hypothetical protein